MRTAIIGAGISGLTTAFYLLRQRPDREVHVFDAAAIPGGTMRTVTLDGFHFEAGGNGFLTNKPDSMQLASDAGAQDLLMPSSDLARKRYIFTDRLHRLPESPGLFLRSKLIGFGAKLRVAGEIFVPPRRRGGEETLQEFGYRRVGKGFTDVFLDAMTAGIYATTPDRVSVNAAFPLVVRLEQEHGGLFRGMLARRKKQAGPGGILMSFKGGVGTFVEHLRSQTPAQWHLGVPVTEVVRATSGYRVRAGDFEEGFDQVVVSTPSHVAAAVLRRLDPDLSAGLAAIEYSPVAVVGFGWKELGHPLDGFGLLTTTRAGLPVLGVLWDSSIFPDRAPDGAKSVRVMIGGQRNPELVDQDDAGLIATARDGLRLTMGVDREPDVTFVQRWTRGIPSYRIGHIAAVDALFQQLDRYPGLHLGGNAYRGIAMNDCVRNGRELAERLAAAE
ncbi:protoporphyrinogen oxidase [Thioalkalivibrio paradoxus]|uniref:Protoporphyrinogen oxidase n=1 Tax=Thioalkalivibrio paradoxus ARh 1 TaxID=713585 RepID=W0DEF4_9GAMM|nr:protoporphyrinogen oxidase [Thioalkalivibrio paradoxus]AHE97024.1 protoporphyrinogen oxidase [Thioalkalivibrio paradoxus ARh 1]